MVGHSVDIHNKKEHFGLVAESPYEARLLIYLSAKLNVNLMGDSNFNNKRIELVNIDVDYITNCNKRR